MPESVSFKDATELGLRSQGRNGWAKTVGIGAYAKPDGSLYIQPVTSRDAPQRCHINIPSNIVDVDATARVLFRAAQPGNPLQRAESYRAVAISTGHLTSDDADVLARLVHAGEFVEGNNMVMERDTGWFLKLYHWEEEDAADCVISFMSGASNGLKQIVRDAMAAGFQMIEFDQAACPVEAYAYYEE